MKDRHTRDRTKFFPWRKPKPKPKFRPMPGTHPKSSFRILLFIMDVKSNIILFSNMWGPPFQSSVRPLMQNRPSLCDNIATELATRAQGFERGLPNRHIYYAIQSDRSTRRNFFAFGPPLPRRPRYDTAIYTEGSSLHHYRTPPSKR